MSDPAALHVIKMQIETQTHRIGIQQGVRSDIHVQSAAFPDGQGGGFHSADGGAADDNLRCGKLFLKNSTFKAEFVIDFCSQL